MNNFFSLVKVQFLSLFGINKRLHGPKGKMLGGAAGVLLYAVIICLAIGYCGYVYAEMFATALANEGRLNELLPIMIAAGALISFFFSFFATGNLLYGFKDYDMLAAMPVKTSAIVFSKLIYMYAADFAFSLILMVPALIVFTNLGGVITGTVILSVFIMLLFSPLLMTALSIIIGAVTTVISSYFRRKNLIQIILLLAVMAGWLWLSFAMSSQTTDITAALKGVYFVYPLAAAGMDNFLYMLLYAAVNLAAFALVSAGVCLTYKKAHSVITAKRTKKDYKLKKDYGASGQFSSLFKREHSRFVSCPMYFLNGFIGAALNVVMAVLAAVVFSLIESQGQGDVAGLAEAVAAFAPALFAFMFLLGPTTNCTISMEGSAFWVIRTMPVKMTKVFNAKLLVNFVYYGVSGLAGSLIIAIGLKTPFLYAVLITLNALFIAALGGNMGLLINILLPKMKWENENQIVKQSAAVFLTVLAAFIFAALFVLGRLYLPVSPAWYLAICAILCFAINVVTYIIIMTKGEKILFAKI